MLKLKDFPKIDAHMHTTSFDPIYYKIARGYAVRFITINTDTDIFPPVAVQEQIAQQYMHKYQDYFSYITSFSMEGWEQPGWYAEVINRIKNSIQNGAVGVKLWKNIGMEIRRKKDGRFLMIDDPFFDRLFEFLSDAGIPVLAHLGEPKNCWRPLDEMTSKRNRQYYEKHPEFHAYCHPEIPGYEEQIRARDRVLEKFPDINFIGAHLGSLEWNYKELAKRFDSYPNFKVDISSRLGHLQIQSLNDYEGVRNFFIQYADRILYGSDAYNNVEKLIASLNNDWLFLATNKECTTTEVDGLFKGIALPQDVLLKIYYQNAKSTYKTKNKDLSQ